MAIDNSLMQRLEALDKPQDALRESLYKATHRDPLREAEVLGLAESRQLPPDTVDRNFDEVKRQERVNTLDIDELLKSSPKTVDYFSDPNNAAISLNDLDVFKNLERKTNEPSFMSNNVRGLLARAASLAGNLVEGVGVLSEDLEAKMSELGLPNAGLVFGPDGVSWSWDMPEGTKPILRSVGEGISEGADEFFGYEPRFTWESFKGDMSPATLAGFIIEQGFRSGGDMAAAVATLPAYIASRTQELAEERVENIEGDDKVDTANLVSTLPTAVGASLLEKIGAMAIFKAKAAGGLKDVSREALRGAAAEGVTEFAQEGLEYLGTTAFTDKELSAYEMIDRQLAGFVGGAGIGGPIAGTRSAIGGVRQRKQEQLQKNFERRVVSTMEQGDIDELVSLAQSAETRNLAPERLRAYLDSVTGDKEVTIAFETVELAQAEGVELPESITSQLNNLGVDVTIPMSEFLSSDTLINSLRGGVKLTPESMTRDELSYGGMQDILDSAQASVEQTSELDTLIDDYTEQLVNTGRMSPKEANTNTALLSAYIKTKMSDTGLSASEMRERLGLEIRPAVDESPQYASPPPKFEEDQDFEGIELQEDRVVAETGEAVTIKQDAQVVWQRTQKKRGMAQKLAECVNAGTN